MKYVGRLIIKHKISPLQLNSNTEFICTTHRQRRSPIHTITVVFISSYNTYRSSLLAYYMVFVVWIKWISTPIHAYVLVVQRHIIYLIYKTNRQSNYTHRIKRKPEKWVSRSSQAPSTLL